MCEVEWYQLDIVGLNSFGFGSGTKLLERGWTVSYSGVARGGRHWAGEGIFTSPCLSVLEFSLVNERVASREHSDCCLCVCT